MIPQRYHVTLTGESPLLMHADNLHWRGQMERWGADPLNKKQSRAGDDRSPAFRWIGCCYHDDHVLGIPSDMLMSALREGGAKVPIPGKRNATYKRQSQSGLVVDQLLWPLSNAGGPIPWPPILALLNEASFEAHEAKARELGFELFLKSARIGQAKHIRVRPRFDVWSCSGSITVFDETITQQVLQSILDMAGAYSGLGDWRPSSPSKPGPWGRFRAEVRHG